MRIHLNAVILLSGVGLAIPSHADWMEDIGFLELQVLLGAGTPDGSGVDVSLVEANTSTAPDFHYLPNASDPEFTSITITDQSGLSTAPSGHATSVGRLLFGNTSSIAPGVTQVDGFDANDWLNNTLFAGGSDPAIEGNAIQNHSWIGTTGSDATDEILLQRLDHQIDRDGFVALAGLANGGAGALPNLLSNSYNSLAVGITNGNHSAGTTSVNGPGRTKPDIVAPSTLTSHATAMTSSAATLLTEAAGGFGSGADESETLRAAILAGATKTEFPSWSHTESQPLDATFGAGELNVFNSYQILAGGDFDGSNDVPPGSAVPVSGWDYEAGFADAGSSVRYYNFEVPTGFTADEISIILTWNARVTDANPSPLTFDPTTSLANMDLDFFDSTHSFLETELAASRSTIDNVEHLHLTGLNEGTYTMRFVSNTDQAFALAWRMETVESAPEPAAALLLGLGAGHCTLVRRRRS